MVDHIAWALTVLAVASAFFVFGWRAHRERYVLRLPRRPADRSGRRRFGR